MTPHITQEQSVALATPFGVDQTGLFGSGDLHSLCNAAIQHYINSNTSPDKSALITRLSAQWAALDPADPFRADVGLAVDALADIAANHSGDANKMVQTNTLQERSKIALACLPDAPYKQMLERLHDDMLAADRIADAGKTIDRAVLEQALDALETLCNGLEWHIENHPTVMNQSDEEALHDARTILTAGRAALAQPQGECDSPTLCTLNKACAGKFGTKKQCAAHPQASEPAQGERAHSRRSFGFLRYWVGSIQSSDPETIAREAWDAALQSTAQPVGEQTPPLCVMRDVRKVEAAHGIKGGQQ
jgi:hypothetical protein